MDLQENTYKKVKKTYYMSAGEVDFEDSSIDVFLEVQNKKSSLILYLTGYIAYNFYNLCIVAEST